MSRIDEALAPLITQGTLSPGQAEAVRAALEGAGSVREHTRRRVLSEILSYVGGAVVLISGAVIVGQAWDPLGTAGRSVLIAVIAATLVATGWVLGGRAQDDSARRLASTLMTAGAILVGVAVGNALDPLLGNPLSDGSQTTAPGAARPFAAPFLLMCSAASVLAVAAAGYLRSRSALGHLAMAGATIATVFAFGWMMAALRAGTMDTNPIDGALLVAAAGAVWLVLSLRGTFREPIVGQFVGMIAMGTGVQALRDTALPEWFVPVLLLAGGLGLMAAYAWLRQWPLLVGGVAEVIFGGTELLTTYTEGIVAAIGSLLLGLAMLAAGLRLFRERRPTA